MASYYFVIKHSRLLMMDLRIMPLMEIIRHKTFTVAQKTAKSAKVSCHENFMVYGILFGISYFRINTRTPVISSTSSYYRLLLSAHESLYHEWIFNLSKIMYVHSKRTCKNLAVLTLGRNLVLNFITCNFINAYSTMCMPICITCL